VPGAASVLRRALLLWGWGHLSLGDRRGWVLALLQPLAICGLLFLAWPLLVFWIGQAVHALRRATALGGAPGGELQLVLFLPFVLAVFTAFWLVGGRHGSPGATAQAYMEAWESNQPAAATALYAYPAATSDMSALWQRQRSWLDDAISTGRATYGDDSGLDPDRPFNSLRVTQVNPTTFAVELVRTERYQTTLLGLVPTAGQRTVVVSPVVTISLVEDAVLGTWLPSSAWRIENVAPAQDV
jgi:hypothetical protein